jgi:hypothetical protein
MVYSIEILGLNPNVGLPLNQRTQEQKIIKIVRSLFYPI